MSKNGNSFGIVRRAEVAAEHSASIDSLQRAVRLSAGGITEQLDVAKAGWGGGVRLDVDHRN